MTYISPPFSYLQTGSFSNPCVCFLQESDIEDAANKEEQRDDYLKNEPQPGTSDLCERLERYSHVIWFSLLENG